MDRTDKLIERAHIALRSGKDNNAAWYQHYTLRAHINAMVRHLPQSAKDSLKGGKTHPLLDPVNALRTMLKNNRIEIAPPEKRPWKARTMAHAIDKFKFSPISAFRHKPRGMRTDTAIYYTTFGIRPKALPISGATLERLMPGDGLPISNGNGFAWKLSTANNHLAIGPLLGSLSPGDQPVPMDYYARQGFELFFPNAEAITLAITPMFEYDGTKVYRIFGICYAEDRGGKYQVLQRNKVRATMVYAQWFAAASVMLEKPIVSTSMWWEVAVEMTNQRILDYVNENL